MARSVSAHLFEPRPFPLSRISRSLVGTTLSSAGPSNADEQACSSGNDPPEHITTSDGARASQGTFAAAILQRIKQKSGACRSPLLPSASGRRVFRQRLIPNRLARLVIDSLPRWSRRAPAMGENKCELNDAASGRGSLSSTGSGRGAEGQL